MSRHKPNIWTDLTGDMYSLKYYTDRIRTQNLRFYTNGEEEQLKD